MIPSPREKRFRGEGEIEMDECERSWTVRKLLRHAEPAALARRAGDRLLHLVAGDRKSVV